MSTVTIQGCISKFNLGLFIANSRSENLVLQNRELDTYKEPKHYSIYCNDNCHQQQHIASRSTSSKSSPMAIHSVSLREQLVSNGTHLRAALVGTLLFIDEDT